MVSLKYDSRGEGNKAHRCGLPVSKTAGARANKAYTCGLLILKMTAGEDKNNSVSECAWVNIKGTGQMGYTQRQYATGLEGSQN